MVESETPHQFVQDTLAISIHKDGFSADVDTIVPYSTKLNSTCAALATYGTNLPSYIDSNEA